MEIKVRQKLFKVFPGSKALIRGAIRANDMSKKVMKVIKICFVLAMNANMLQPSVFIRALIYALMKTA